MNYKFEDIIKKLEENNIKLKNKNSMLIRLRSEIENYLNIQPLDYDALSKDEVLLRNIKKLINDEKLVKDFEDGIIILRKMPWTVRVSNLNNEVKEDKENIVKLLNQISLYIYNNPVKFYTTLDEKLMVFDKIGKEEVSLDNSLFKIFYRLGLSNQEILDLTAYVTGQNMKVYNTKIKEIEKESLKKEKNILMTKLKKEERNDKIKKTKERKTILSDYNKLLADSLELLKSKNFNPSDKDYNEALAYQEILLDDLDSLLIYDASLNVEKHLLVNISFALNNINKILGSDNSCLKNEDLKKELEKLNILYHNYLNKIRKINNFEDKKDDAPLDKVNIHYLIDSKTCKSYYKQSIESKDSKYVSDAERLIEKMKTGLFESKQKSSINDVENCFFIQQGLTYLAFIRVSEKDYIIISTSKWHNLFSTVKNIYNNELEQIDAIKKEIKGDRK